MAHSEFFRGRGDRGCRASLCCMVFPPGSLLVAAAVERGLRPRRSIGCDFGSSAPTRNGTGGRGIADNARHNYCLVVDFPLRGAIQITPAIFSRDQENRPAAVDLVRV